MAFTNNNNNNNNRVADPFSGTNQPAGTYENTNTTAGTGIGSHGLTGNHGHGTTGLNTSTGLNAGAHGTHGTHGTTGGAYGNQTGLDPIHNNNNVAGAVPSSALPGSASHTHPANQSTGSKELVGKIEVAAGKVLHSAKLVQKGEIKLEQAQQIKVQGAELNEAERLENEAGLRRERAVNHGADTGHLGRPHHAGAGPGAGGNDLGPGAAAGGNVNSRGAGLY